MSPAHSEQGIDDDDDDIVVDAEPRYSGPERDHEDIVALPSPLAVPPPAAAEDGVLSTQFQGFGEMEVDAADSSMAPVTPLRLLEDERVHLQRSGLRLTDFEVKGTLGSFFSFEFFWGLHLLTFFFFKVPELLAESFLLDIDHQYPRLVPKISSP
jgi:hypothetical protein